MKLNPNLRPARSRCQFALCATILFGAYDAHALPYDSIFIKQTPAEVASNPNIKVPQIVYAGMPFEARLNFKNSGDTTWVRGDSGVKLILVNSLNNETWGGNVLDLPSNIATNDLANFRVTFTAPSTPGNYSFQWKLARGTTNIPFGDASFNFPIAVEAPPIIQVKRPDNTLENIGVMVGYQGWFSTQDDGFVGVYKHWLERFDLDNNKDTPAILLPAVDMWPDLSEFNPVDDKLKELFRNSNRKPVYAFSSTTQSVVQRHFNWMRDYGIEGAFVGRFASNLGNSELIGSRDQVLKNALTAAKNSRRYVSIDYDMSGLADDIGGDERIDWIDDVVNDWKNQMLRTEEPWLKHNGRPVVRIFGLGYKGDKRSHLTVERAVNLLSRIKAVNNAYIVGGVPSDWNKENGGDAHPYSSYKEAYALMDMIAPWNVGNYKDDQSIEDNIEDYVVPDMIELVRIRNQTNSNGVAIGKRIGYMPYAFPGFSWSNVKRTGNIGTNPGVRPKYNQIPRRGGQFYWKQIHDFLKCGSKTLGIAMFDEIDEGTAIFKLCNSEETIPKFWGSGQTQWPQGQVLADYFVHLNQTDAEFSTRAQAGSLPTNRYPVDWYLQLTNQAASYLDGSKPSKSIPVNIPIVPNP